MIDKYNVLLEEVISKKVLGLFIDKKLAWTENIDCITSKTTKNI